MALGKLVLAACKGLKKLPWRQVGVWVASVAAAVGAKEAVHMAEERRRHTLKKRLERLDHLLKKGKLSREEYQKLRKKVIDGSSGNDL